MIIKLVHGQLFYSVLDNLLRKPLIFASEHDGNFHGDLSCMERIILYLLRVNPQYGHTFYCFVNNLIGRLPIVCKVPIYV